MIDSMMKQTRAQIWGHLEAVARNPETGEVKYYDLGRNMLMNLGKRALSYLLGGTPGADMSVDTVNWDNGALATDPTVSGSMSYLTGRVYRLDRVVIGTGGGTPGLEDETDTGLAAEGCDPKWDSTGYTNAPTISYAAGGAVGSYTASVTIAFKLEQTEGTHMGSGTPMNEAGLALYYHYDSTNTYNSAATGAPAPGTTQGEYNTWEPGLFAIRYFNAISKDANFEFEYRWTVTFSEA